MLADETGFPRLSLSLSLSLSEHNRPGNSVKRACKTRGAGKFQVVATRFIARSARGLALAPEPTPISPILCRQLCHF